MRLFRSANASADRWQHRAGVSVFSQHNNNEHRTLIHRSVPTHPHRYYLRKNYYKTASLMSHSCRSTAVLAKQDADAQLAAYRYRSDEHTSELQSLMSLS